MTIALIGRYFTRAASWWNIVVEEGRVIEQRIGIECLVSESQCNLESMKRLKAMLEYLAT
jgi:hypothetical protein